MAHRETLTLDVNAPVEDGALEVKGMPSTTTDFTVARIEGLRRRAAKASRPDPTAIAALPPEIQRKVPSDLQPDAFGPQGWSKSNIDPMQVLRMFKALRMREGYVLRAYQYRAGDNGNGFVWAMPADAPFPEPDQCTRSAGGFLDPPRPEHTLDDTMEAIDGDATAWSYMSASMLARALGELGAIWHGCDWSTHDLIDGDPRRKWKALDWQWERRAPNHWQPRVVQSASRTTVTFHTVSGLAQWTIYRHVDTYPGRGYTFTTKSTVLAIGPGGYIF